MEKVFFAPIIDQPGAVGINVLQFLIEKTGKIVILAGEEKSKCINAVLDYCTQYDALSVVDEDDIENRLACLNQANVQLANMKNVLSFGFDEDPEYKVQVIECGIMLYCISTGYCMHKTALQYLLSSKQSALKELVALSEKDWLALCEAIGFKPVR